MDLTISAWPKRDMRGQHGPSPVCCMCGSMWWHVERVQLWLLLSGLVWPLLKISKTSRSGSLLVQGKGSSFN